MKEIITVDIGNTAPSVMIFEGKEICEKKELHQYLLDIDESKDHFLSCVGQFPKELSSLKNLYRVKDYRKQDSFFELKTSYGETLGEDRLVQLYYLYKNYILSHRYKSILLIDSGSFTTFDLINEKGHQGGHIFPGLQKLASLYSQGELLSDPQINSPRTYSLAQNTEDAISGGLDLMVQGSLEIYLEKLAPEALFISGGNREYFKKFLEELNFEGDILEESFLIHHALRTFSSQVLGN